MPVAPTVLRIGGLDADIQFRGQAPGTVGVMQVNARVPEGVARGGAVPVVLSVGAGDTRAGVFVAIQ